MKKMGILGGGASALFVLGSGFLACSSSSGGGATGFPDGGTGPAKDAASDVHASDAHGSADAAHDGETDAGTDAKPHMEAAPPPDSGPTRHVLVTYNGTANVANPTTMLAVNLTTGTIDGKILSADTEAITDTSNASSAFFLEQTLNNMHIVGPTTFASEGTYPVGSDPYAVNVVAENQVYVLSYGSNTIDVFDLSTPPVDGGMPSATVDLSSLLQAGDADGEVEVTAAAYVASSKLLYVVLGNLNFSNTLDYMGSYDTLCASTTSTVIALDTTNNNAIHSLGGTALGGGITLQGYDPVGPSGFYYDVAGSRLLILEGGCNPPPTSDGGAPGAVKQRGVEAIDLTTNTSSILLDASSQGFPGSMTYIDSSHAVLSFYTSYPTTEAFLWNPMQTTLGTAVTNAPSVFDYDGNGNLVGATLVLGDGGSETTSIVSVSLSSGAVTTLVADPLVLGMGSIGSVGVWPRP